MHTNQQIATRTGITLGQGLVPSPMLVIRELTKTSSEARSHTLYFRSRGLSGPGCGKDNPQILAEVQPIQEALLEEMHGAEFFISMIPLRDLHGERTSAPDIPSEQRVPQLRSAFEPLRQALTARDLGFDCIDIDVSVNTGRGLYGAARRRSVELQVIGRKANDEPKVIDVKKLWPGVAFSLDHDSPHIRDIFNWYSGAEHGLIMLQVTRPRLSC
jgi:hypothetical protein